MHDLSQAEFIYLAWLVIRRAETDFESVILERCNGRRQREYGERIIRGFSSFCLHSCSLNESSVGINNAHLIGNTKVHSHFGPPSKNSAYTRPPPFLSWEYQDVRVCSDRAFIGCGQGTPSTAQGFADDESSWEMKMTGQNFASLLVLYGLPLNSIQMLLA